MFSINGRSTMMIDWGLTAARLRIVHDRVHSAVGGVADRLFVSRRLPIGA
jgi:hypothetical protein